MTTSMQHTLSAPTMPGRRIVDAPMRMFHALFALCFAGAYLSADSERWRLLHVTLGYTFAGLLALRLIYGLTGPRQARLGLLTSKLTGGWRWLRALRLGDLATPAFWRQGQNLLMALALALLLGLALPLALSGWAAYNEWGGHALEKMHEFFGNAMLAVVFGHIGLSARLSLLRRRNLALPMLTGRADGPPGPDLVTRNRAWLAALLLLATLAFGAWMWQPSPADAAPAQAAGIINMVTIERSSAMNTQHVCMVCGLTYEPARGLPEHGIAPGTPWNEIPLNWRCPECLVSKADFVALES
jgi:rubredoxin/cytochrome b